MSRPQPNGRPPAIVFGGEAIAVPVVRALARAGIEVRAAGAHPAYDIAGLSRHCAGYVDLGPGDGVVERYLDWLADGAPRGVLIPCCDEALELTAHHRAELEDLGHVPMEADDAVLAAMLDKGRTYELARGVGIPTPRTWIPGDGRSLEEGTEEVGFPCAVKPVHSHEFAHRFGGATKLLVADDRPALERHLARMRALDLDMLVTEIVPGSETELLSHCGYLDERGEPLAQFTFHKVRQFPIHYGRGTYVVSDWNEDVIRAGLRFLRGIGLRGPFHVEFKRDPRSGELKLLECNHRLTIEAMLAPADLPLLAYNRALGLPPPPRRPYRCGTYQWTPFNDVRAFLDYRRAGELTLRSWLRSLLHRPRFHAYHWSDPLPAAYHGLARIANWLRRRRRARGTRSTSRPPLPPVA